jgi:predicted GNAT family N-acyltransferase
MDFGYVRTADEYRQVLELRKMAYSAAKKLPEGVAAEETADIFDTRSRIMIGRYRGDVVATMRLMFHEPNDVFEHEQYITLPPDFPPRGEIIEITRVCTHPAYRGSDLLLGLFKDALMTCVQSKRRYLLGSATKKLLPLYTNIGFKVTPLVYRHEALGGEEHFIFLGDMQSALAGEGVGPLVWNAIFADIWNFLDLRGYVDVNPVVSTRLAMYRLVRPLTQVLARRFSKPRAAKKSKT